MPARSGWVVRLATSKSADYTTLVYSKGAYVLYMLRMMMFDFNKRDDSKFNAMLKDFLEQYSWKEACDTRFCSRCRKALRQQARLVL